MAKVKMEDIDTHGLKMDGLLDVVKNTRWMNEKTLQSGVRTDVYYDFQLGEFSFETFISPDSYMELGDPCTLEVARLSSPHVTLQAVQRVADMTFDELNRVEKERFFFHQGEPRDWEALLTETLKQAREADQAKREIPQTSDKASNIEAYCALNRSEEENLSDMEKDR